MFQHHHDVISRNVVSATGGNSKNSFISHRTVVTITVPWHALFHAIDFSAKIAVNRRAASATAPQSNFLLYFNNMLLQLNP
jgi:hypothetical protein